MDLFNSNSDNSNDVLKKKKLDRKKPSKKKFLFSSSSDNTSNTTIKYQIEKKKKKNRKKRILYNTSSDNNSDKSKTNKIEKKKKKEKSTLFSSNSDKDSIISKTNKKKKSTLFSSNSDKDSIISKTNKKKKSKRKLKRCKQNIYYWKKDNDKLSNATQENQVEFTNIKSCNDNNFNNNNDYYYEEIIIGRKNKEIEKSNNIENYLVKNISKDNFVNKKENYDKLEDFNKLQNYDETIDDPIAKCNKHKSCKNLKTYNNKNDKNLNDFYDDEKSGVYRLINFEKFKKRAYRNLNFLSIVDITRTHSESDEERENSEKDSEDDILNLTDKSDSSLKSNQIFDNSFFSNDYQSSKSSDSNNKTLDIYNYYYLDNNNNSKKDKNFEKSIYNSNKYSDLYSYLFNINEQNHEECEKEEVRGKEKYNEEEKSKKENNNNYKNSEKYKDKKIKLKNDDDKKKILLKKNLILYRNFKNINNEISRQNNIKGLKFKEMVYNFIRIINRNVLTMNQEENKKKKKSHYNNISDNTSEVESVFNLENNNEEDEILQKAQCLCIFCSEKNKILNKNELDLIIFKYIEANKKNSTVIKPFFMDNYIFISYLNFSIHYQNIILCKKEKNIEKLKNSKFYKYSINMKRRHKINKIIHFVAGKITLTTLALYIQGFNFLNDKEQFVAVINFLKWKKIRKNYFEILKLKRNKENLKIHKSCSFLINAVDKFCALNNIHIDDMNKYNVKTSKIDKKKKFYFHNNKFGENSLFSYNELKIEQIENSLNLNLKNSNLQFLFFDPLYISFKNTFHLYPEHIIILF
ncbi:conserved Plasmodium protein, unknown function [Plasmodium relictum]|uniref:Uncharacterized protein n=1 Tax=Plasmodium relictum TaxID=85471 RepID=A0A1J1HGR3_PLARL|nr:conserved Plasmodium protein, unknown function [Plasmodium relictum]CRH03673.1 conserved Plasmodium protein, unknown function [Plasmodium relictum]